LDLFEFSSAFIYDLSGAVVSAHLTHAQFKELNDPRETIKIALSKNFLNWASIYVNCSSPIITAAQYFSACHACADDDI